MNNTCLRLNYLNTDTETEKEESKCRDNNEVKGLSRGNKPTCGYKSI